jgi:Protein of unknown function (DUF3108)
MNSFLAALLLLLMAADTVPAQNAPAKAAAPAAESKSAAVAKVQPAEKNEPQPSSEVLNYTIAWPTGLSLGEAKLRTTRRTTPDGPRVETEFHLDASVPGFPVLEDHHSVADGEFCSMDFTKQYTHGRHKADETMSFDQSARKATRETKGGGKSELNTPPCAKDALSYIGYIRRELGAGRLPPHQSVYYGAAYDVKVEFTGTTAIKLGEASVDADRIVVSMKGPTTEISFEVYFSKDATRAPVLVRVPLALATFSMELVR